MGAPGRDSGRWGWLWLLPPGAVGWGALCSVALCRASRLWYRPGGLSAQAEGVLGRW